MKLFYSILLLGTNKHLLIFYFQKYSNLLDLENFLFLKELILEVHIHILFTFELATPKLLDTLILGEFFSL